MTAKTKSNLRRMTQLRMMLERERNSGRPSAAKIDAMMAEYKALENQEHVVMVFGERGRVQSSVTLNDGDGETLSSFMRRA